MAYPLGALRRRILTPNIAATTLSVRGFHEKSAEARELLERIGGTFLFGYGNAVQARNPGECESALETLPTRFRGFGYEGAAMGYAMLDGLPFGHRHHVVDFLAGRAGAHVYMVHIGVGWALARLPGFRRQAALSALTDPLLRWLVLDGYGFHQAYFHTAKYVHGHHRDTGFAWPFGHDDYVGHAIDQGVGRALWFVGGTDPAVVADLIDGFGESRRADLYSGAGLAATYAGGVDEDELLVLCERGSAYRPQIAQACAFAAEARMRAGLAGPETAVAAEVLWGGTVEAAAGAAARTRPAGEADGVRPAYEAWRRSIADQFVAAHADQGPASR